MIKEKLMENTKSSPVSGSFPCPPDVRDERFLTDQERFDLAPMGLKFKIIHEQYEWMIRQELSNENLTYAQMNVLRYLSANQKHPVSQKELCSALHVTHPTMVGILQRMREKGLIEQTVDPDNRRRRIISPAPAGQALVDKYRGHRDEKDALLVKDMTPEEIRLLRHLLGTVHNNLTARMQEIQKQSPDRKISDPDETKAEEFQFRAGSGRENFRPR